MLQIYLYVKTHNVTGLKYFGKTTNKNPYKYKGSGIYWRKHLSKHGNDVTTEIVGIFNDAKACETAALNFSQANDITNSFNWANLKEENGQDGSPLGVKFSEEHKEKIRQSRLGKCYNPFSEETRKRMREASKLRNKNRVKERTHHFMGEQGKKLAKKRNEKLLKEGKHNFQTEEHITKIIARNFKNVLEGKHPFLKNKGTVPVIDREGSYLRVDKDVYKNQSGEKETWEYVFMHSKEGKKRRGK